MAPRGPGAIITVLRVTLFFIGWRTYSVSRIFLFADTECERDLRGRVLYRHSFRGQRSLTSLGKITDHSWDITFRQDRAENGGRDQKHESCVENVSIQEALP